MSGLITIGYSTRSHKPEFIDYLKKSSGFKKLNVIEKITNGEKSLSQVYNEILNESETDIVVLCHDDSYFDSTSWYHKITSHFEKSDYGILGVAGTTLMPKSGKWWEVRKKMYGIVNHEHLGKKWESKYSQSMGNDIKEVVVCDGLFLAIKKSKIKKQFDESVPGFHFYDIEFCFQNFLEEVKLGVIFNVRITHKSIGETNEVWETNRQTFEKKYSNVLPKMIHKKFGEKIKCLYSPSQLESSNNYTLKSIEYLTKIGFDVDVILDEKLPLKNLHEKINKKKFLLSSPPGYKLGDGKWQVNNNGSIELSKPGVLYLITDPNYDLIVLESKENFKKIIDLYSSSPKITNFISDKDKIHRSVVKTYNSLLELDENNLIEVINHDINNSDKQKIKIISGHSERGGSTTSFIRLINKFNEIGFDATFYGPHDWHLDKCKSGLLKELVFEDNDIIIAHFLNLPQRPRVKKVILSLHEKNLFDFSRVNKFWDSVVFLNEEHRKYHSVYDEEYEIIPNLTDEMIFRDKKDLDKVAGIIGTIDNNKQTHISIQRALNDGCQKIYLFGTITENNYFDNNVRPLLSDKVILYGYEEDKQKMYDMIGRAYLSSISEVAPFVKQECLSTGTKFFGNTMTNFHDDSKSNQEIIEKWKELILK